MARKPPLVLLPGLLCDKTLWRSQIEALGDVAEPQVADLTQDDSIAAMVRRLLAAAPPRFALAGLSMGGYCAFDVMRQAPECVERLALLDTGARADTPEQTSRRRGLIELAENGEVTAMAERVGKDAFLRQQKAIMGRVDSRPSLGSIRCPTLMLCGRQDALTPPDLAEEIAAGIPGARLDLIDNCGHLSTMERPDAVNAELRQWLTA